MKIEEIRKRVKHFDTKAGWNKTDINQLIEFMQQELNNLKQTPPEKKSASITC